MINLLKAAQSIPAIQDKQISRKLFLTGFSQGGHATLAAHRLLEANPIQGYELAGSASIAGPMDLAEIQLPNALLGASTSGSLYVAWIALSYARVYDKPISDVLSTPWDDIVPTLFDGLHDGAQIVSALPASPPLLLTEEVKTAIRLGDGHWFVDRLRENSVDAWPVKVPLRAYYADNDVDVIPKDVTIFAVRARQTNQDRFPFEAISVGEFDHDGSVLEAAPAVVAWFNSLAREAEPVSVRTDTVRTDTHN